MYDEEPVSTRPIDMQREAEPKLQLDLFGEDTATLVVNKPKKSYLLDYTKHLLVGFVKEDNQVINQKDCNSLMNTKIELRGVL